MFKFLTTNFAIALLMSPQETFGFAWFDVDTIVYYTTCHISPRRPTSFLFTYITTGLLEIYQNRHNNIDRLVM